MFVIKIHAILACFFIPAATLYFVSGALYTLDIEGKIDKQLYRLELDSPFSPDLDRLSGLASAALEQRKLRQPTGDPAVSKKKGAYEYHWGDLKTLVVIKPTDNPLQIELIYRQRNPLAQVMRVHRAEAGTLVKAFSISMATALLLILSSGVFLAMGMPKLRKTALLTLAAGCAALLTIFV
jgi:hypothetical protein